MLIDSGLAYKVSYSNPIMILTAPTSCAQQVQIMQVTITFFTKIRHNTLGR